MTWHLKVMACFLLAETVYPAPDGFRTSVLYSKSSSSLSKMRKTSSIMRRTCCLWDSCSAEELLRGVKLVGRAGLWTPPLLNGMPRKALSDWLVLKGAGVLGDFMVAQS